MSYPRTIPVTLEANAGRNIPARCQFVRVVDSTGPVRITWPDGSKLNTRSRRWYRCPVEISDFQLDDISGASNTIELEVSSLEAMTGDDRRDLVGTAEVQEAGELYHLGSMELDELAVTTILAADPDRLAVLVQLPDDAEAPCFVGRLDQVGYNVGELVPVGEERSISCTSAIGIYTISPADEVLISVITRGVALP